MNSKSRDLAERACKTLDAEVKTLSKVLHGDEKTYVTLGGKPTPSIRNMVNKVKTDQNEVTNEIKDIAADIKTDAVNAGAAASQAGDSAIAAQSSASSAINSANKSAHSATDAQRSADEAARLAAAIASGFVGKRSKAELDADLAHPDGTLARVVNDPDSANNGDYIKVGDEGTGYWWPASKDRLTSLESQVNELAAAAWRPDLFLDFYPGQTIGDDRGRSYSWAVTDANDYISSGVTTDGQVGLGDFFIDADEAEMPFELSDSNGVRAVGIHLDGSAVIGNTVMQTVERGDDDYVFSIMDKEGRQAFAIDNNGNTHLFATSIGSSSGLKSLANQRTDYMHIFSYGQSLSRGSTGIPLRSTSQPYNNKTFLSGVLVRPGANSDLGITIPYDSCGFKPLTEERPGTHPSGETPVSSALNGICSFIVEKGDDPLDYSFIGSAPGWGGQPIANLMKSAASTAFIWNGMITQVKDAMALAAAEGKSYSVWGMLWAQGENDAGVSMEEYKRLFLKIKNEFADDVHAVTGQDFIPPVFTYQTAAHRKYSRNDNTVAIAQWQAARDDIDIIMACPAYQLPHAADNLHLTNDSYVQFGKYYAKAFYQTVFEKNPWKPLWPEQIIWQGRIIDITFHVPNGSLVWDTNLVTQTPNYGFDLWRNDSEGSTAIESLSFRPGGKRLVIKLAVDPQEGDTLTYGRGRVGDALAGGPVSGPRGNLRDQAGDSDNYVDGDGVTRYMHNWCVMFEFKYER